MRRVVIALGGNALLRRGERADASVQLDHIAQAAPGLAKVAREWGVVIVHGNGPQVGLLALEREADRSLSATYPLDALVAETQGLLGYWLQQAIHNGGLGGPIVTVVTQTVVDPNDAAFATPTKFIGRIYDEREANALADEHGWHVAADGDHWRRVVASPLPVRVVESGVVEGLLGHGVTVICAGGAGSAVVEIDQRLTGVEAVVDKDHVASLLAVSLHADLFVILTDVPAVIADYGTPSARPLGDVTVEALRREQFAEGSMGPKVVAACNFAAATGRTAVIGSLDEIDAVVAGTAGTRITAAARPTSVEVTE
ncbi:MAG: carbamate kinase [Ilumatobacteraceae bacterium]|nr:carbamate kinase [Ilumatobacteraceae bacterium]